MTGGFRRRLTLASIALLIVIAAGTIGYFYLGEGRWSVSDCLYMTVITLTTVGFGEVLAEFHHVPHVREFTMVLILFGMGSFLYFASTLTAFIIEGELRTALREKRMRKRISKLEDHVIVCGAGTTGRHVIEELIATRTPVVAIDLDPDCLEAIATAHPKANYGYVVGDATNDNILAQAHPETARGFVAAMHNDKDNLYLVVSARQLRPSARIVARGAELQVLDKLKKAGADTVVSPNFIGGMRIVSEMIRPHVVRFLDNMLRDDKDTIRIEEVSVPEGSGLSGCTLAQANLRKSINILVLAIERVEGGEYIYNPSGETKIESGMTLVVLGSLGHVAELRELAEA